MKNLLTSGRKLAAVVLLASSGLALAQSLGEPATELWIGQPLDVSIPARFASADSRDACVQAEVAYGEARLPAARVHTAVVGTGDQRRVRITSERIVDEPLVTLSLRTGCGNTMTRSYTLLPEMPTGAVLARLLQPAPAVAFAAPAAGAAAAAVAPNTVLARQPPVARVRGASPLRAAPAPASLPRLRLDAIGTDAHALLRVSANLSAGDASRRATAALLWQAISADPRDTLRNAATLQKLENELAQLRQAAGSTRAEMAALRQRLDAARPWYLAPRAVQVLALVLAAAAGAAALLAWRARRASHALPWFTPTDAAPLGPALPAQAAAAHTVDVDAPVTPPAPAAPPRAGAGLLRVETLAATFEGADFLASLGLHSEAMGVLEAYLQDSASPSPFAFFELMRVCSLAEDSRALDAVRRRYAQVHGVEAPALAALTASGGLESQRELAAQVTRAWGRADVLAVIEQALFEPPAGRRVPPLAAARDLICLYDVAMLLVADGLAAPQAQEHPLAPWAHAEHAHEAHALAQAAADDVGVHRFGLDIDLTVAPQPLGGKAAPADAPDLAARLLAEKQAARAAAERAAAEAEEAFNAAVASERSLSRY